uniref:Uncharacterized protein n=1 Tax=Anguilla anguilla TaxID=7936 RepID=A0A0E9TJI4_ANGAN
MPGAVCFQKQR